MPINNTVEGLPWRSSGSDSAFPLPGAWVQLCQGTLSPHATWYNLKPKKQNRGSSLVPECYLRIVHVEYIFFNIKDDSNYLGLCIWERNKVNYLSTFQVWLTFLNKAEFINYDALYPMEGLVLNMNYFYCPHQHHCAVGAIIAPILKNRK